MRYRPKRENYASGEYGEIDYQERLERYCTYLENKISKLSQHDVSGQSEQLKCQCKIARFTRNVDADFNPLCGRCGKSI